MDPCRIACRNSSEELPPSTFDFLTNVKNLFYSYYFVKPKSMYIFQKKTSIFKICFLSGIRISFQDPNTTEFVLRIDSIPCLVSDQAAQWEKAKSRCQILAVILLLNVTNNFRVSPLNWM